MANLDMILTLITWQLPNETVEKPDLDRDNYTQTQDLNALLGNHPFRPPDYNVEYDPLSVNEYQKRYEEQQIKYMKKRAAKLGFQLVPTHLGADSGIRERW